MRYAKEVLKGNQLAGSRLIRLLEEGDPQGIKELKVLYPHTGKAFVLGITGPPGVGKSTILDRLISEFRKRGMKVGVVAVDPSSPISGGAILGDRLRMGRHAGDGGVFVRSIATRGHLGGLSKATKEAFLVLDAMGFDIIFIETVGVGQDEVAVRDFVHTTAVVSMPGMGDEVQSMKAGLLEIGNIYVVNKADLPGAEEVRQHLQALNQSRPMNAGGWRPPVIMTAAAKNEGIAELADAFMSHRQHLAHQGRLADTLFEHELRFFRQIVQVLAVEKIFDQVSELPAYIDLIKSLKERKIDPYSAAERLIKRLKCKVI
ncbi:MAG: methylmalonyl Co-A mutase-associated GTPase MeaB [Deltaproteobacteria bacterium]|nr:MAG: methylmalonyl Co-A mutase-associated GTPase MeaB [Deltaproteobacteria bacterium]